jgi:hypothetical protein
MTFNCECTPGWTGVYCQALVNYCDNNTCENNGVCWPLFLDYRCECLGSSYSGRHCEIVSQNMRIHQIIARCFAYIAIIAICTVFLLVIMMDLLKYGFGIDVVPTKPETVSKKKIKMNAQPRVILRLAYVHTSTLHNSS